MILEVFSKEEKVIPGAHLGEGSVPDLARDRVGLCWEDSGVWLQCQTSAGCPAIGPSCWKTLLMFCQSMEGVPEESEEKLQNHKLTWQTEECNLIDFSEN